MSQDQGNVVGGPADDVSVREFAGKVSKFAASVLSRDYLGALRESRDVIAVAADLLGLPSIFGDAAEADDSQRFLNDAADDCRDCEKALQGPQPVGDDHEADPKKLDPGTVLLIVQLVVSLIEAIRKRRNPA